jgi:hypothetical protein
VHIKFALYKISFILFTSSLTLKLFAAPPSTADMTGSVTSPYKKINNKQSLNSTFGSHGG